MVPEMLAGVKEKETAAAVVEMEGVVLRERVPG